MSHGAGEPARPEERSLERTLWVAVYVLLALAPVAFLVAAPPSEDSEDLVVGVALGFVALTVIALQVLIPSRAPAFTAPFGIDALIHYHRRIGALALALVAAHVVVVTAQEDDFLWWLDPRVSPLPGRLGIAAAGGLVLLGATALWRRALGLRYEAWRGLHALLALAALAFAFGHVITVGRFSQTGPIRWAMLGFVVAALVAAFYLRVVRPFAAIRRPYRLARTEREHDGSITLELEAEGHDGAPFAPGQFAWLKHAGTPYALTEHPFSYASSGRRPERPSFTIKPVGDFTRAVETLEPGARMLVDGPHGSPALVDDRDTVLVAGGSGITPTMSVLRTAAEQGDQRRFLLVYATRDVDEASFREELAALSESLELRVVHVPSRPSADWPGPSGRVGPELLDLLLPADRERWAYFVCGPPGMTDAAVESLERLGVRRAAIRAERFALA